MHASEGVFRRARALLGAMALILAAATPPARAEPCAPEHTDALRPITGHVWVWPGVSADTGPDNAGHVLSTTILHLGHALWVVDPGPSLRFGQGLRAALACRWQQRPSALLLTHAHADNTLAASAFRTEIGDGSIALLATPDTRERMRARCPDCLKSLGERLGATLMQGTDYVLPTGTLDEAMRRQLTRRGWQVMTFTDAHTEHDLALWHPTSRTLIAGGLLYGRHLPELAQGSLLGWLR